MAKKENIQVDKNNSPQDINREIKSLRNWNWTETPNATKERDITIGQYVEIGDVKGFISRYEGQFVYVEDSMQQGKLVKIPLKKLAKLWFLSFAKVDLRTFSFI